MENKGPVMLTPGRVGGIGFRPIAKGRAMACGSNPRALPDFMAAASAVEPLRARRSWISFSRLVFRVAGRESP